MPTVFPNSKCVVNNQNSNIKHTYRYIYQIFIQVISLS